MASFKLRYSPLFHHDLDKIIDYLLLELKNEIATQKLINDVQVAIKKCLSNPLDTASYHSINTRQHPYRRILVGDYLIYYVVIDNIMTIRRILYGRRDLDRIL